MRKLIGYLHFKTKDLSAKQPIWIELVSENIIAEKRKLWMFKLFVNFRMSAMHYQEYATMIGFLQYMGWKGKAFDSRIFNKHYYCVPVYKMFKFFNIKFHEPLISYLERMQTFLEHNHSVLKLELKPQQELRKMIMRMKSAVML